jgi:hypothetical protein
MRSLWSKHAVQLFVMALLIGFAQCEAGWAQQLDSGKHDATTLHGHRTVEDWNSLTLAGSELIPQTPIFGEKGDFRGFTRELWRVQWRVGDPIDLYIIRPKFVPKPRVVLYLYSYPSETDRFRDNDYCERLASGGVAAVGFVSALTGQRYSMRPMKEWFVSELQESLSTSVHDVQMILNYLSQRDDLDVSNVGMFGTGSGGTIAILAAAVEPRIKAIDVLGPWGDWPDLMATSAIIPENERPNYVKPEFLKKVAGLDPVSWLPRLKTEHVRIQDIEDDTVTPKVARARIESAAPATAKVLRFENTRDFYRSAASGRVFEWVKEQLRLVPEANPAAENTRTLESAGTAAKISGKQEF